MAAIIGITMTKKFYAKSNTGSDMFWTSVADNFLRYKENGWNTDNKFTTEKIKEKHQKFNYKYKG